MTNLHVSCFPCCYYYCHDSRFVSVFLLVLKHTAIHGFLIVVELSVTCYDTQCAGLHALCLLYGPRLLMLVRSSNVTFLFGLCPVLLSDYLLYDVCFVRMCYTQYSCSAVRHFVLGWCAYPLD